MEAASAASAAPALKISTKCSGDLAPPEAMTGTDTALEISAVSFVSKPSCVPSRSTEVSRISPAPNATAFVAIEWATKAVALGAGEILLTSVDRDGTQLGFDTKLTAEISKAVSVPVIASGGARSPEHFVEIFKAGAADAALAASIFHDGVQSIRALKAFLAANGIEVRRLC